MPHGAVLPWRIRYFFQQPRSGAAGTDQGYRVRVSNQGSHHSTTSGLARSEMSDPFQALAAEVPCRPILRAVARRGVWRGGPNPRRQPQNSMSRRGVRTYKSSCLENRSRSQLRREKGHEPYLGDSAIGTSSASALAGLDPSQIGDLATTQVAKPYSGYITGPLEPLSAQPSPPINCCAFPKFTAFAGSHRQLRIPSTLRTVPCRETFSGGLEFWSLRRFEVRSTEHRQPDDSISGPGGGLNGSTIGVQDPNNLRRRTLRSTFDISSGVQFSYV